MHVKRICMQYLAVYFTYSNRTFFSAAFVCQSVRKWNSLPKRVVWEEALTYLKKIQVCENYTQMVFIPFQTEQSVYIYVPHKYVDDWNPAPLEGGWS